MDVLRLRVGGMISDHAVICFVLPLTKPSDKVQWVICRAWRRLSRDAFASDLEACELCADLDASADTSADDMVQLYRGVLTALLDKHCPAVTVRRRPKKTTAVPPVDVQEQPRGASDGAVPVQISWSGTER